MATQKFISLVNGIKTAITALVTSDGNPANSGGKIVATDPATGKLDMSVMPSGIGSETDTIVADVGGLSAGDLVNIWNNAGTITARKADASTGKPAHGFVLGATSAGNNATVHRPGQTVTGLTSLDPGAEYFLSAASPGQVTLTIASTTGHLVQSVGIAMSATTLAFNPQEPITLA